jgi:hypothetical protein
MTLNIEEVTLRAVEVAAARKKTDRVKWIVGAIEEKLRADAAARGNGTTAPGNGLYM